MRNSKRILVVLLVVALALCACVMATAQSVQLPTDPYGKVLMGEKSASSLRVKSISLSPVPATLGLITKFKPNADRVPVRIATKPAGCDVSVLRITSSKPHVASVEWENGVPYIRSIAPGKSVIKVVTTDGKVAKKTVQVAKGTVKMKKVQLRYWDMDAQAYVTKLTEYTSGAIAADQNQPYIFLELTCTPSNATYYSASEFALTSSNDAVASVTDYDDYSSSQEYHAALVFLKGVPGTAKITATARDGSKKKAVFTLTVKPNPPASVDITDSAIGMQIGTTRQLAANVTDGAQSAYNHNVVWSSSNKKIATVDADGKVRAIKAGTATITCKSAFDATVKDTCAVTVSYSKAATNAHYRFYGIGNSLYTASNTSPLPSCENDVRVMAAAFQAEGYLNETRNNCTRAGICDFLDDIAADTTINEADVTVFYYSGHGILSDKQSERGALIGTDGDIVPVATVASYLNRVPGTVVVMLDSCLSGQFIASKSRSAKAVVTTADAEAFNGAVLAAFQDAQTGLARKSLIDDPAVKDKYKILTACTPMQKSWVDGQGQYSLFTGVIAKGIGMTPNWEDASFATGKLYADKNKDGVVTVSELYNYGKSNVRSRIKAFVESFQVVCQQEIQVWPAKDATAIINRKA